MKFENMVKLEATVLSFANRDGKVRHTLKAFNPEKSTTDYIQHAVLRKAENGAYVLAEKPDSDSYLTYVLAFYQGNYVTWSYNYETDSCNYGHYFGGDFEAASKDFMTRGWEHLLLKATESKEWKALKDEVERMQEEYTERTDGYGVGASDAIGAIYSEMGRLEDGNNEQRPV